MRECLFSVSKPALNPLMPNLNESHVEEAALSWPRELGCAIGPAQLDDEGNLRVCIDGVQFCAGEKYTILEMGWAVYLAEDKGAPTIGCELTARRAQRGMAAMNWRRRDQP